MKSLVLLTSLGLLMLGCNCEQPSGRQTHELLHATLWMQSSAEYAANSIQTYNSAHAILPAALADSSWTACLEQGENFAALPPAIVLDVDETVLDNTAFEARLIRDNDVYRRENWVPWCNEAQAPAVPGAKEFLDYAASLGVEIFYLTNRGSDVEEGTRRNLVDQGLPLETDDDYVLTKGEKADWGSDKGSRRKFIADSHRVVMLFGDNFNDFASDTQKPLNDRRGHAESLKGLWGSKWFMLANPAYGDWESAIYNYQRPKTDEEQLKAKYGALIELEHK